MHNFSTFWKGLQLHEHLLSLIKCGYLNYDSSYIYSTKNNYFGQINIILKTSIDIKGYHPYSALYYLHYDMNNIISREIESLISSEKSQFFSH